MKDFSIRLSITVTLLLLLAPHAFALTLDETLQKFEQAANKYDNGEISVAQLIVLLEHYKDENNAYLQENGMKGWGEKEAENALSKFQNEQTGQTIIQTSDLNIFLGSYNKLEDYYGIGYSVGARKYTDSYYEERFANDFQDFKQSIRNAYESNNPNFTDLGLQFRDVAGPVYQLSYEECVDLMSSVMEDEISDGSVASQMSSWGVTTSQYYTISPPTNARRFVTTVHEDSKQDCLDNCWFNNCEQVCENYPSKILLTGFCAENDTSTYLSIDHQGFRFGPFVNKVSSALYSTPYTNPCEPYGYEPNLRLREKLQESLDEQFFDWYVQDFLGDDMKKYSKAGSGFERLMGFFEQTERKVSQVMECKGQTSWPQEFEEVSINYEKGGNEFRVWEEKVSVDGKNADVWSTLYTYKIMPEKAMARRMIEHQVSEQSTFSPDEGEVEDIKSDENAMKLVNTLTSGFGDSLEFTFKLEDEGEKIVSKHVIVNDEVILSVSEPRMKVLQEEIQKKTSEKRAAQARLRVLRSSQNPDQEELQTYADRVSRLDQQISDLRDELNSLEQGEGLDFTATLTLDDLYDFMNRMASIEGKTVKGPSWVDTQARTPMMISERIGLLVKLWTSVSVEPWTSKIQLSMNVGNIMNFIKEIGEGQTRAEEEMVSQVVEEYNQEMQSAGLPTTTEGQETQSQDSGQTSTTTQSTSDQIEFKVELTYGGSSTQTTFKAKNLGSQAPDFKVISEGKETIMLGSEQKGWVKYEGSSEWTPITDLYPEWSSVWKTYYTDQFQPYYSQALQAQGGEYTSSGGTGSVRIYDINKNPNLPDSVFQTS